MILQQKRIKVVNRSKPPVKPARKVEVLAEDEPPDVSSLLWSLYSGQESGLVPNATMVELAVSSMLKIISYVPNALL